MVDLRDAFDRFDALVASCRGVVDDDVLEAAAESGRAARRRAGYLGDTLVVALAGGTGSGKSSLLNALAGDEVSEPGARRPTTAVPVAWIPENPEPGLMRLLDDLGVDRREGQSEHPDLAVIDLPDTDSVVVDNRHTVERLLPLVDVVVWVVDPEKYNDEALHGGHLRPLADWSDRFVFAINQVDRVPADVVGDLVGDLCRALEWDGIADPVVVATAGDPVHGIPSGLDELLDAIRSLGSVDDVVRRRIIDGLRGSADRLLEAAGGAGATGFSSRWPEARDATVSAIDDALAVEIRRAGARVAADDARAVGAWLGGRRPASVVEGSPAAPPSVAGDPIRALVTDVANDSEPALRTELTAVADEVDAAVAAAAVSVGSAESVALGPPPSWWNAVRLLSLGTAGVVVVCSVLVIDAARSDTRLSGPVIALVVSIAALVAIRLALRRSAHRRVDAALAARSAATRHEVAAELERRVGRPVRDALRTRSAPVAAHSELILTIHRLEEH